MIDKQGVRAEREGDDSKPEPVDERDLDLVGRDVERPDHGQRRPSQSSVPPPDDQVSGEITMTPSALNSAPPM